MSLYTEDSPAVRSSVVSGAEVANRGPPTSLETDMLLVEVGSDDFDSGCSLGCSLSPSTLKLTAEGDADVLFRNILPARASPNDIVRLKEGLLSAKSSFDSALGDSLSVVSGASPVDFGVEIVSRLEKDGLKPENDDCCRDMGLVTLGFDDMGGGCFMSVANLQKLAIPRKQNLAGVVKENRTGSICGLSIREGNRVRKICCKLEHEPTIIYL